MTNMTAIVKQQNLVPYKTIVAATAGDIEAINAVVNHYDRYTSALSTRPVESEYGIISYQVDLEMKRKLEIKLIIKILDFKIG
ncbi:helix-turn-helix domain-containing protein [Enterococcus plantarum]|uniref:helix-turn-helix domain-containing protein n=1 Tax=Enterococcus plantarum TaxID=1077675 RepID=UPI001A8FDBBA|nr:helix-turn-helix domain-containing protein [Enterococcus plantarum]MBO0468527.1 helix-turn-helix domain-containing protein [Enterococcus plantarum]